MAWLVKWRQRRFAAVAVTCFGAGLGLGMTRPRAAPGEPPTAAAVLLPSENEFRNTLRSCLGPMCFTAIPAKAARARVMLAAVPSAAAEAAWAWVKRHATNADADLIATYGYGKNHGMTRIVRLALPLAAENSTLALRQAVRWHCRVSHVAAHTAMLTVDETELLSGRRALERVLSFVGVKIDHVALDRAESDFDRSVRPKLVAPPANRVSRLDAALVAELGATAGLRNWPCPSLWLDDVPDDEDDAPRAFARARAAKLAPNCSAPFTTCSVPRDRCEATGTCPPRRPKPLSK